MTDKLSADIQKSFALSRQILTKMIKVIDSIIGGVVGHPAAHPGIGTGFSTRPATKRVLAGMLQALGSSSNTLIGLSDKPGFQSRDCFSISRSIIELAVNISYICAEGDAVTKQAERHANQKAFRDLDRRSAIGNQNIRLCFSTGGELEVPEEIVKNIEEFTARSGREKNWTDLNIDARCEKIERKFGDKVLTPLHWARFLVYRHSSEILHGTFFGVAFFCGLTDPKGAPATVDEFLERIAGQHLMVLLATVLSQAAVVKAVSALTDVPELATLAEGHIKDLKKVPFFNEAYQAGNDIK